MGDITNSNGGMVVALAARPEAGPGEPVSVTVGGAATDRSIEARV